MTKRRFLLAAASLAIVCVVATPLASHGTDEPPRAQKPAFKGYELYSWQSPKGEWRYALVEGTNRLKSWEEVEAAGVAEAEFRRALGRLARGETVTWCNWGLNDVPGAGHTTPRPAKPPTAKVQSILDTARRNQVNLEPCDIKVTPEGR